MNATFNGSSAAHTEIKPAANILAATAAMARRNRRCLMNLGPRVVANENATACCSTQPANDFSRGTFLGHGCVEMRTISALHCVQTGWQTCCNDLWREGQWLSSQPMFLTLRPTLRPPVYASTCAHRIHGARRH